jgi:ABC-type phosphate transport system permease subunit
MTNPAPLSVADLHGNQRRTRTEHVTHVVLFVAAAVTVLVSVLIVYSLLRETWTFVTNVDWSSVWSDGWFPRRNKYDIKTLIVGSLIVTARSVSARRSTSRSTRRPAPAASSSRPSSCWPASRAS